MGKKNRRWDSIGKKNRRWDLISADDIILRGIPNIEFLAVDKDLEFLFPILDDLSRWELYPPRRYLYRRDRVRPSYRLLALMYDRRMICMCLTEGLIFGIYYHIVWEMRQLSYSVCFLEFRFFDWIRGISSPNTPKFCDGIRLKSALYLNRQLSHCRTVCCIDLWPNSMCCRIFCRIERSI